MSCPWPISPSSVHFCPSLSQSWVAGHSSPPPAQILYAPNHPLAEWLGDRVKIGFMTNFELNWLSGFIDVFLPWSISNRSTARYKQQLHQCHKTGCTVQFSTNSTPLYKNTDRSMIWSSSSRYPMNHYSRWFISGSTIHDRTTTRWCYHLVVHMMMRSAHRYWVYSNSSSPGLGILIYDRNVNTIYISKIINKSSNNGPCLLFYSFCISFFLFSVFGWRALGGRKRYVYGPLITYVKHCMMMVFALEIMNGITFTCKKGNHDQRTTASSVNIYTLLRLSSKATTVRQNPPETRVSQAKLQGSSRPAAIIIICDRRRRKRSCVWHCHIIFSSPFSSPSVLVFHFSLYLCIHKYVYKVSNLLGFTNVNPEPKLCVVPFLGRRRRRPRFGLPKKQR